MKITFLGHGLDDGNNHNVGKQLVQSFESENYRTFNGFIAFASISGTKLLQNSLSSAKKNYNKIRFYIGIDNKGTSQEALDSLLKQDIETFIYYDEKTTKTYHPKLYIFEGEKYSRIIIGSSNLTSQGIITNIEASLQLDFLSKSDKQGKKVIKNIKDYYANLLDLSSKNLRKLDADYLLELISKDLLYSQFKTDNSTDNKNNESNRRLEKPDNFEFNIQDGFEQNHLKISSKNKIIFTSKDHENFAILLNRYISYKENKSPSGIVSKNTDDKELFFWYQKMKALYNKNDDSIPPEYLNKLLEIDFPFGELGRERKRLLKWNKMFDQVVDYKNKFSPHNDYTYIPQYKDKSNKYYEIGRWIAWQKQRRKGNLNYGAKWTEYEENKMQSINFVWDSKIEFSRNSYDDNWANTLVQLEKYYSKKKNFKTIPSQSTYLGHWLNDQITRKLKQEKINNFSLISEIRVELLGSLLDRNGVDWEWEKQKHKEGIYIKIESWKFIQDLKTKKKLEDFKIKHPDILKKHRSNVAQLKSQSKRWNNEKNAWKMNILKKEGFPIN